MDSPSIASLLIWFVVFVFSTTFHEFAHAALAYVGGDKTAYEGGQVSLDPMPHIRREPFGMVVLPLISLFFMGWAMGYASAPYNPRWAERNPTKYALMSAAGPLANFALAAVAFVSIWALVGAGQLRLTGMGAPIEMIAIAATGDMTSPMAMVAQALSILLTLNVLLGMFNLLPLPPLDGASVLEGLSPGTAGAFYQRMRGSPGFGFLSFIIAIYVFGYIGWPVIGFTIRALHSLV
jgi:Zn-dependent protease